MPNRPEYQPVTIWHRPHKGHPHLARSGSAVISSNKLLGELGQICVSLPAFVTVRVTTTPLFVFVTVSVTVELATNVPLMM